MLIIKFTWLLATGVKRQTTDRYDSDKLKIERI